ncbi:MAG: PadR family transcriptional regulator [Candidatus Hermodarchaeota archaeon]|nr:PadR family transcriptional regulator [Candidatus Hermodarchaeota archaeon]
MPEEKEIDECCPPDCCDMRGMLSFQILWELGKKPMNGQELAEQIGLRRGSKPTPGTIYPALKELSNKNLISGKREGRQVIYTLTDEGRTGLEVATQYFYRVFNEIIEAGKTSLQ